MSYQERIKWLHLFCERFLFSQSSFKWYICYADQSLVGDALVGKLPKCCKTTSPRCWQFTVALITPCSFLWKGIFKLLAIETSCRWPAFSLLWLTWAFPRQLMRFLRNYHASVNATHPLPTPLPLLCREKRRHWRKELALKCGECWTFSVRLSYFISVNKTSGLFKGSNHYPAPCPSFVNNQFF